MHESMHLLFDSTSKITYAISDSQWSIDLSYQALPDPQGSVAHLLANRHTNRHPYKKEPVVLPSFPDQWPLGGKVIPITDRPTIEALGNAVKTCSAARFNCQELHEWLFSSLRWNDQEAESGDGLDIASLHLPPGGKQFMRFLAPWSRMKILNRLGLYRFMAATDARFVYDAPAIVVVVGNRDPNSTWEAGRIMQATWLTLNGAGLTVHPYYVVTDIANRYAIHRLDPAWRSPVERELNTLNQLLNLASDQQIHILLRVGIEAHQAIRSARLPLGALTDPLGG